MNLVAYTRVSRIGDRDVTSDSFITVDLQLAQIESYAKAYGHEIVAHFSDLDESLVARSPVPASMRPSLWRPTAPMG